MHEYLIEGGYPIQGTVKASGNKNAAFPCLAATLLTSEPVILHNIPEIQDTKVMLEILKALGAKVKSLGKNSWEIQCEEVTTSELPSELNKKIRGSIVFAGPLLARTGKCKMTPPGGDVIGRRRVDTHFLALQALGVNIHVNGCFDFTATKLVGADIFLDEASVTATENAVMDAALSEGTTILQICASEPHVQDICKMLNAMGARISGIASNLITIEGVDELHGTTHTLLPDMIEIGSFIGMAAMVGDGIRIKNVSLNHLGIIPDAFRRLGVCIETDNDDIIIPRHDTYEIDSFIDGTIMTIADAPWPGLTPDLLSVLLVVATQARGSVLFHQKMFESRLFFVDKLIDMGAQIILCDPHRAVVVGLDHHKQLRAGRMTSPDIRAGIALLIAAMSANGTSRIDNIAQIDRGYENIENRLNLLGASIIRVQS